MRCASNRSTVDDNKGMAAGAAVAVVGWWSGYKLGGMLALMLADYLQSAGIADYWQMTFLFLGVLVVLCNIGLMFVPETGTAERAESQRAAQDTMVGKMGGQGPSGPTVQLRCHNRSRPASLLFPKKWSADRCYDSRLYFSLQDRRGLHGENVNRFL